MIATHNYTTRPRQLKILIWLSVVTLLSLTMLNSAQANQSACLRDSVGKENQDGKLVILHKVGAGETLYALSRRYNTQVATIKEANSLTSNELALGQVIKIPTQRPYLEQQAQPTTQTLQHKVQAGEGLYSIARQYNVSVDDIKNWNNLTTSQLDLGQVLTIKAPENAQTDSVPAKKPLTVTDVDRIHVVEKGQTLYGIATMYKTTMANLRQLNNLTQDELNVGQKIIVGKTKISQGDIRNTPTPNDKRREHIQINKTDTTTSITGFKTIVESGFAAKIDGNSQTRKHLALHRTAQTGTILQVKNEMNGVVIYVRVIGPLPNTGANDNLLIRVSSRAYERLGATDKRIPVIVTYPKP